MRIFESSRSSILLSTFLSFSLLFIIFSDNSLSAQLATDGAIYEIGYTGSARTFRIPNGLSVGTHEIKFNLLGADGGGATLNNCTARGGDGAYVTIAFDIGNGVGQLRPGGFVRFIVGQGGESQTSSSDLTSKSGGDGGGGTAILYTHNSNPDNLSSVPSEDLNAAANNWVLLAVAGGGSGGFRRRAASICWSAQHGEGGRSSTGGGGGSGSGSGGSNGQGGSNGASCFNCNVNGTAGAGAYGNGESYEGAVAIRGGVTGGATLFELETYSYGYGGGGIATLAGSGGGGGYSGGGGGGGNSDNHGGGGGSFVNSQAKEYTITAGGNSEVAADNGFAEYQILQVGPPVALCKTNTNISIGYQNTSININPSDVDNGSYDLGDGIINLSLDRGNCNDISFGTHLLTLTVTDDDGNVASCQSMVNIIPNISGTITMGSVGTEVHSGTYKDYLIPKSRNNSTLSFALNGGDGGKARLSTGFCGTCSSRGGYGAKTNVSFNVGCGSNELEPGGVIRLIVGQKGNNNNGTVVACVGGANGSGGGGSGILYKAPGCADWLVLAAAGGGGGAYQGMVFSGCVDNSSGRDGGTNANGNASDGKGETNIGKGGSNGGGSTWSSDAFRGTYGAGGGGYSGDGSPTFCGVSGEYGAGKAGGITGGAGGSSEGVGCASGQTGGYGFGGGGFANTAGGGGGGYSGGGGGGSTGGGGGGGSYVNTSYATSYSITTEAYSGDPTDGYINFSFSGGSLSSQITASCVSALNIELDDSGTALLYANSLNAGSFDDCNNELYFNFNSGSTVATYTCNNVGTFQVNLNVSNNIGGNASCSVPVTISESEDPVAVCQNISKYLNTDGTVTIGANEIDGGSSDNCSISSMTINNSAFTCEDLGTNLVELSLADASGNTARCFATVTILEPGGAYIVCCDDPVAICQDIAVTLDATGNISISSSDIDNGSTAECTIANLFLDDYDFACEDIGENIVSMLVTDTRGNSSSCSATVTVIDHTTLDPRCKDITIHLDQGGTAIIAAVDLDNGSMEGCFPATHFSADQSVFSCFNLGANTVTMTISGTAGSASCTSTVTVIDQVAPMAFCQDVTIMLDATGMASVTTAQVDNGSYDPECAISYSLTQMTFGCSHVGGNQVTLTVTDEAGNTDACNAIITVEDNVPPLLDCFDHTIVFNGEDQLSIYPTDVSVTSDNCGIASEAVHPNSFSCDQVGETITVTVTVVDVNGNVSTCTAEVYIDGLPCGYSQDPDGINCTAGNEVIYDPVGETFTLNSTGCHYGNPYNRDQSAFVQYELCGDGEMITQVTSLSGMGWAGIQMRESMDAGAKKFALSYNGSNFSRREVRYLTDGAAYPQQIPAFGKSWLKITRSGNQFRGYVSTNGTFWQLVMVANITMNNCIDMGLFVTNFSALSTVTAQFCSTSAVTSKNPILDQTHELVLQKTASSNKELSLYPNPTRDIAYINLEDYLEQDIQIELHDLLGRPMARLHDGWLREAIKNIDLSDLPAGTYYLSITTQGKVQYLQQIVKL